MSTQVYEIKIGRKSYKVRATTMLALDNWAKANSVKSWRLVGMQSIAELAANHTLKIVA